MSGVGRIDNDVTLPILAAMAVSHAEAGADIVGSGLLEFSHDATDPDRPVRIGKQKTWASVSVVCARSASSRSGARPDAASAAMTSSSSERERNCTGDTLTATRAEHSSVYVWTNPETKKREGKGRIPVVEIMMATPIVRKYILDGEFDKLKAAVGNRESGSQSFDQHLTELFQRQIIDVNEAQRLASNVDALKLALRGISNSDTTDKGDPSAAFMLDGIYIARPQNQNGLLLDVDRIEVLRGPQGTLYGRNTTAGVINVISRAPTRALEAEFGAAAAAERTLVEDADQVHDGVHVLEGAGERGVEPVGVAARPAVNLQAVDERPHRGVVGVDLAGQIEARRGDEPLQPRLAAVRALAQRRLGHFLQRFEMVPAGTAAIFVDRHGARDYRRASRRVRPRPRDRTGGHAAGPPRRWIRRTSLRTPSSPWPAR